MKIQPYLFFNGRCDEAIEFYGRTLGAQVTEMMRFKDSKETMESGYVPADFADKVMHSSIRIGEQEIMASDGMTKEKQNFQGVSLTLTVANDASSTRWATAARSRCRWTKPSSPRASAWSPTVSGFRGWCCHRCRAAAAR
jgi:PhnB protein